MTDSLSKNYFKNNVAVWQVFDNVGRHRNVFTGMMMILKKKLVVWGTYLGRTHGAWLYLKISFNSETSFH